MCAASENRQFKSELIQMRLKNSDIPDAFCLSLAGFFSCRVMVFSGQCVRFFSCR
ncbi:hypothetical protein YI53_004058 [Salmonella enterica subsp. enterica]|nr:hypothetical protein [Salmonella enterica subsp. enterica]